MEKTNNEFFDDVISLLETCKNNMVNAYSERKGEDATKDMMKMYGVVMPLVDLLAIKHPEFNSGLYGKKTELMFFMNAARIYKSYPAFYNAISALPSKNHILKNSKEEDKELYAYYL